MEIGALREVLSPVGTLVDLYIVTRKDKHGHRFGFARYNRVRDINSLIENLNKLDIQGRKIFAKIAKFERSEKQENNYRTDLREVINSNRERRDAGMVKSYAEIIRGTQQNSQQTEKEESKQRSVMPPAPATVLRAFHKLQIFPHRFLHTAY